MLQYFVFGLFERFNFLTFHEKKLLKGLLQ